MAKAQAAAKKTEKKSARRSTTKESAMRRPGKAATQPVTEAVPVPPGEGESAGSGARALPVLYRRPVPLTAERHGRLGLIPKIDFSFAAHANSVPVNAAEFRVVMQYYPIVFAGRDPVMAVAILGVAEGENLFVDGNGSWREGHYIPAYVRRYPFIFLSAREHQQFVLCVDEDSNLLVEGGEQPLFENGKPSDSTQRALNFCSAYQNQSEATKTFAAAMADANLLVPNQAEIRLASGQKLGVSGFQVIDEERFNALPDATFQDWRSRGWLQLIYAHLFSAAKWNRLIRHREAPGA